MTPFEDKEQLQASIDSSPFNVFCGFHIDDVDKECGRLVMRMPMRPEMERLANTGQMHGGPIACLIDTAGCYACMMKLGYGVPTVNLRTDYLRPVINTGLTAVATVRRAGATIALADIDVFDDTDTLVATGRGTYSAKAG